MKVANRCTALQNTIGCILRVEGSIHMTLAVSLIPKEVLSEKRPHSNVILLKLFGSTIKWGFLRLPRPGGKPWIFFVFHLFSFSIAAPLTTWLLRPLTYRSFSDIMTSGFEGCRWRRPVRSVKNLFDRFVSWHGGPVQVPEFNFGHFGMLGGTWKKN